MVAVDEYAGELADAVDAALPNWVVRSVSRVMIAWAGEVPGQVQRAAERAAAQARDETGRSIRELLGQDIDDQRSTPLSLLRSAVAFPTVVLRAAGVPPVERDEFRARAFPDDVYDLTPATFADVDPSLHEAAMAWGAAKAMAHRERHGSR